MLKRSSIAGMPCLFCGILIYIRTTQKRYKGEERRQYDTHLQEAEQAQPILVYLDISLKVLDTLKNLTKDTHEVCSNINNLNLVMVFLDRHCYCTQCHTTRAPATPTGIYYKHHRDIDFFLSRCNARACLLVNKKNQRI